MLALIFRTKGSSVIPSLTLRKIIDGCRGERTWRRGGGVKSRGGEMGRNKFHKKLLYATRWQDDQFKG